LDQETTTTTTTKEEQQRSRRGRRLKLEMEMVNWKTWRKPRKLGHIPVLTQIKLEVVWRSDTHYGVRTLSRISGYSITNVF